MSTCNNGLGTPRLHPKVDLGPVGSPEPLRGHLGTGAVGIEDRGRRVQSHHPFGQGGAHVEGIEEPDQAEYAKAYGYVDEDFADVDLLFLLFANECGGLLFFPQGGGGFTCHHPLPLPAHPSRLQLKKKVALALGSEGKHSSVVVARVFIICIASTVHMHLLKDQSEHTDEAERVVSESTLIYRSTLSVAHCN